MRHLAGIALVNIAATLLISTLAVAIPAIAAEPAPNFYQLHGQDLETTYMISQCTGTPYFKYQDPSRKLEFIGDQIRTVGTETGTLVTVTIIQTVDTGSTTFSLLVPAVNLDETRQAPIATEGITTDHKFSIDREKNERQLELYKFTGLTGEAKFVASLC